MDNETDCKETKPEKENNFEYKAIILVPRKWMNSVTTPKSNAYEAEGIAQLRIPQQNPNDNAIPS